MNDVFSNPIALASLATSMAFTTFFLLCVSVWILDKKNKFLFNKLIEVNEKTARMSNLISYLYLRKECPVPPLTHKLSKSWNQPDPKEMIFLKDYVCLRGSQLSALSDYSLSVPSGVYEGKMWKSNYNKTWYLRWYEPLSSDPNKCKVQSRKIILLPEYDEK